MKQITKYQKIKKEFTNRFATNWIDPFPPHKAQPLIVKAVGIKELWSFIEHALDEAYQKGWRVGAKYGKMKQAEEYRKKIKNSP